MVSLTGQWFVQKEDNTQNTITLPGTIGGSGLGEKISTETQWYSGLHNPFWFEREEYKYGLGEEVLVPFLSQPRTYYAGQALYERTFETETGDTWYFFVELSKWRLSVKIDDKDLGTEESLVAPFLFGPVELAAGLHKIEVLVDNSMIYPYRPDGHGISDALGAGWNGMGGRIELMTALEYEEIKENRKKYAAAHKVEVTTGEHVIIVNGKAEYMRGTHFGGGFPLTLIPEVSKEYWDRVCDTVKEWGFNLIRFHSFCPPEQAFLSADEKGVFLQPECGMWNVFNPEDTKMQEVLLKETKRMLEWFGHHPSFIMLSPTNEPSGKWYGPLREWVAKAKEEDKKLGYAGRRLFTAESGWFYDVPPAEVTGTDYIFFHRSAFGPIHGGMIRNRWGWNGKDYSPSLEGCTLPVLTHETGQWCAYPDFDVIDKYKGPVRPGNYEIFQDCAKERGVLPFNKDFVYCSGRNQVRFLKEELEANFRTKELSGFEYLDMHDYTGQGTAVVGILDPFFDNKGYTTPEEFKRFNSEIVLLARIASYVLRDGESVSIPTEVSNFSGKSLEGAKLSWVLKKAEGTDDEALASGSSVLDIPCGKNTFSGNICFTANVSKSESLVLELTLEEKGVQIADNSWEFTVFKKPEDEEKNKALVFTARTKEEAKEALKQGKTVVFFPYISDLDHDCPAVSPKTVYWNAQMGPSWSRGLGMVIDEKCPVFKDFPTDRSGGFQWEEVLNNARALNIPAKYSSVVRIIDDWNRNFPLSLITEGKAFKGKLLICTADLSGTFEERPVSAVLRAALYRYAASADFEPANIFDWDEVTGHIRPLFKGFDIIKNIKLNGETPERAINITDINPNMPFRANLGGLPAKLEIELEKPVNVKRLYMLPIQSDRDFPGVIRRYSIEAGGKTVTGEWKNAFDTQWSDELNVVTDRLTLTVLSTYSMGTAVRWVEQKDGFAKIKREEPLMLTIASLGVDFEDDDFKIRRSDSPFWREEASRRHKEIDI